MSSLATVPGATRWKKAMRKMKDGTPHISHGRMQGLTLSSPARRLSPGGSAQDYLEPLTLMSYRAAATKKIRLGTSVLIVPYRNPLVAAKMLATLDVLSGGRIILGAGVGWLPEGVAALGAPPFGERGRVTDEYIRLMRECWTKDRIDFQGAYYRVSDIVFLPKPVQKPAIPIWIGGHTEGALRRAGELGDGWHPIGLRPPAL